MKLHEERTSSLISRNVTVMGKRTSVRLESEMWREFRNITKRENCTMHELISLIYLRKHKSSSLTSALRVFIMLYFRSASTEEGHNKVGHGDFSLMKKRVGISENWDLLALRSYNKNEEKEKVYDINDRLSVHLLEASFNN